MQGKSLRQDSELTILKVQKISSVKKAGKKTYDGAEKSFGPDDANIILGSETGERGTNIALIGSVPSTSSYHQDNSSFFRKPSDVAQPVYEEQ